MPIFVFRVSAQETALPKIIRHLSKICTVVGMQLGGEVGEVLDVKDIPNVHGNTKTDRNAEVVALYEADPITNSAGNIANQYGLSRERICQILRKSNSIGKAQERRAAARESLAEEIASIREESAASFNAKLDQAVNLCRDGMSMRLAADSLGFPKHSSFVNALGARLRAEGIPLFHGPHRDFSKRRERVLALSQEGHSPPQIVKIMRALDDPSIYEGWIYNNVPEAKVRTKGDQK